MDQDADILGQATRLHEETPHAVQVSVTLSNDTRELLSEIRDSLNDQADEPILNTNDVVQLALRGTARYHEKASETDDLQALTAAVHDAVDGREGSD